MTVCIAASIKDHIVIATDNKLSIGSASSDACIEGKSLYVEGPWSLMYAGNDVSPVVSIVDKARVLLKGKPNTLATATCAFKKAYQQRLLEKATDVVLSRFGIDMETFRSKGAQIFTSDVFGTLCDQIAQQKLSCTLLVYGFDNAGEPHIFTVSSPGTEDIFDEAGFWAIGNGAESALGLLFFRNQRKNFDLARTIYHVLEAKYMAESAAEVGRSTHVFFQKKDHQSVEYWTDLEREIRRAWNREGRPRIPNGVLQTIRRSILFRRLPSWETGEMQREIAEQKNRAKPKRSVSRRSKQKK